MCTIKNSLTFAHCLWSGLPENFALLLNFDLNISLERIIRIKFLKISYWNSSNALSSNRWFSVLSLRSKSLKILFNIFRSVVLKYLNKQFSKVFFFFQTYSRFALSVEAICITLTVCFYLYRTKKYQILIIRNFHMVKNKSGKNFRVLLNSMSMQIKRWYNINILSSVFDTQVCRDVKVLRVF